MDTEFMLTTVDNPYSPFDQFTLWNMFDKERGHNTCELIARLSNLSYDLTQKEENEDYIRVVNSIIANDLQNKYMRFYKTDKPKVQC